MALIAMAVWDTDENGRTAMTRRTLESLYATVNWSRHRLIVVDNGSCLATRNLLDEWERCKHIIIDVCHLGENYGTAKAVNWAWRARAPSEIAIKLDNDVVFWQDDWADRIEEAMDADPSLGIVGLKRKDLEERPDHPAPFFRSKLRMLPHVPGQRWIVVEEVEHVMGTCQGYSPALLAKIGFLEQMGGLYGFDDSLAAIRCHVAGFKCAFLPWIEIDHIDPGGTGYQKWKERYAGDMMAKYHQYLREYQTGARPIWSDSGWPT